MSMTYTDLVENIVDYTQNNETSFMDHIDEFIRHAERKIWRTARIPSTWQTATVATTNGVATATMPTGTILPLTLHIDGQPYPLDIKDASFIRAAYPDSTQTGTPKVYAIYSDTLLLFGPTPDATYSITMDYHGFPTSIVDAGYSWLGENAEEALLYTSLVNAYVYMKGDQDMLQQYNQMSGELVSALVMEHGSMETDETEGGSVA